MTYNEFATLREPFQDRYGLYHSIRRPSLRAYFRMYHRLVGNIADDWHYTTSAWECFWVASGLPLAIGRGLNYNLLDAFLWPDGAECPGCWRYFQKAISGTFWQRHDLRYFFPGVVRIAHQCGIPIIPAGLFGFRAASPILCEIRNDGPIPEIFSLPLPLFSGSY